MTLRSIIDDKVAELALVIIFVWIYPPGFNKQNNGFLPVAPMLCLLFYLPLK